MKHHALIISSKYCHVWMLSWWRHSMDVLTAVMTFCHSLIIGVPSQEIGNASQMLPLLLVSTDLHINTGLSGWDVKRNDAYIWRHCNANAVPSTWWRHQMEWNTFRVCWPFVRGIRRSPVNSSHRGQWGGAFDVFFDLHLNKRLSEKLWGWWF